MNKIKIKNIWLILKTSLFVITILIIKLIFHKFNLEFISINNLFSGIIAANVFLMGFLLSGVLADYKESEKIPCEITCAISALHEEFLNNYESKKDINCKFGLQIMYDLSCEIKKWFLKNIDINILFTKFKMLNKLYIELEKTMQPAFIVRLKNETINLKKLIIRTEVIRDTNFISSGYTISVITTFLMCVGLILSKIEHLHESLFFVTVITFLMIFLLLLISDLDNPFGYNEKFSAENISLFPLFRCIEEIEEINKKI